jgi:hypothetical protein
LPSRSVLGQPAEALVSCGALLLGELCAFSLETQWRKAYLRSRANTQEAVLRMSEEVASYVFHELRNDTNASMGVFESIVDAVASGKASLDPELTSMVNEGRVHARHAALVISNMYLQPRVQPDAHSNHNATLCDSLSCGCCLCVGVRASRPIMRATVPG